MRPIKALSVALQAWYRETKAQQEFREQLPFDVKDSFAMDTRAMITHATKEARLATKFRTLLFNWLYKKYNQRFFNDTDPITMSKPETQILVFFPNQRGSYQFEASSLQKTIMTSLTKHDYLFPEPQVPKNPFTNLEFPLAQWLSIVASLRKASMSSWQLEGFCEQRFSLPKYKLKFYQAIRHTALQEYSTSTTDDAIEHFMDFVEFVYDHFEIVSPSTIRTIRWAARNRPNDLFLRCWKKGYVMYYELYINYPSITIYDPVYTPVFIYLELLLLKTQDIRRLALEQLTTL